MTVAGFAKAMPRELVYEGGKVDDPQDRGGRTNQGVTQTVYNSYRKLSGLPVADVYTMTDAERDAIYKKQFWDAIQGDALPDGVDFVLFDGAVNSGPRQAIKWLQRALGIGADGVIGAVTLEAVQAYPDNDKLIAEICARRVLFLQALGTFKRFGKGWTARVANVKAAGQAWATGSVGPNPIFAEGGNAKANVEDAKTVVGKPLAHIATGIGSAAAVIPQATDALAPVAGFHFFSNVILGLTIAGSVLAVSGIAYTAYSNRRKTALADALDTAVA